MHRVEFERHRWSLAVRIEAVASGGAQLQIGPHPQLGVQTFSLTTSTLAAWEGEPSSSVPAAFRRGRLATLIEDWLALPRPTEPPFRFACRRIALRVGERRLAVLPWERAFRAAGPEATIRISPTPPMAADLSLTFPLRFLQVDPGRSSLDAEHAIDVLSRPGTVFGQCSLRTLGKWRAKRNWPTVEVLHFASRLPASDDPSLLSTARPDETLSVGGLGRLTSLWQTRLVVLECADASQARSALLLGTALADRGGPAVLVAGPGNAPDLSRELRQVYLDIICDQPLDCRSPSAWELMSLIAGASREELVRPSNIVADIGHLAESLSSPANWSILAGPRQRGSATVVISPSAAAARGVGLPGHWSAYRAALPTAVSAASAPFKRRARASLRPSKAARSIATGKAVHRSGVAATRRVLLNRVGSRVQQRDFGFSVPSGTGFAAAAVGQIRRRLNLPTLAKPAPAFDLDWGEPAPEAYPEASESQAKDEKERAAKQARKYVNPLLAQPRPDGSVIEVTQQGKPLQVGELYYLYIDIGPPRGRVKVIGATSLQEAHLKSKGDNGVWVEIGLTGLDFEVHGPGVREVWVPEDDRLSQAVAFAVTPRKAGAARLRYSVYVEQNLLHSYVLAARTADGKQGPARVHELAAALGTPWRSLGRTVWLARLEYSLSGRLVGRPGRALSIVTNHVGKESTITVKGADTFGVRTAGDLSDLTAAIRRQFDEISTPPREDIKDKRFWPYGFGTATDLNEGSAASLEQQLMALAPLGWELFDKVIPQHERAGVASNLAGDDQIIHVASILLDEVIPWAAVYDRPYDADREEDGEGNPVEHGACLAALPSADGRLPPATCGEHPHCILHPAQQARRAAAGRPALLAETVACPRHFWGIRHQIELPPQQTESAEKAREQALKVENRGLPKMAVGVHGGLSLHSRHMQKLASEIGAKIEIASPAYRRDPVIRALDKEDLDIVYLYCHAEGGVGSQLRVPVLKFRDLKEDAKEGVIKAGQLLGASWLHRPLVIVNGCESSAFRPDALSPFIEKLITDRSGGAFVGTEITVWEALATCFAEWLLADFASGKSIGNALARARRRLLAIHNPLGLVYTLYGATELALVRPV